MVVNEILGSTAARRRVVGWKPRPGVRRLQALEIRLRVGADAARDLGGDLTRAQETLLESAAQKWVIASSLADFIARQATLVTKKRAVVPVVTHYLQVTDSLERTLDRLGLDRKAQPVPDLDDYLRAKAAQAAEREAATTTTAAESVEPMPESEPPASKPHRHERVPRTATRDPGRGAQCAAARDRPPRGRRRAAAGAPRGGWRALCAPLAGLRRHPHCPFIFHGRRCGTPRFDRHGTRRPCLGDFQKVWDKACTGIGLAGRIPHDLRRSGVKHYIDAGVDPHTVMAWSGHRTDSMLRRYHIIDLDDLRRAGKQASRYRGPKPNVIRADFNRTAPEPPQDHEKSRAVGTPLLS